MSSRALAACRTRRLPHVSARRYYSSKDAQPATPIDETLKDPRPKWFFTASRISTFVIIPVSAAYLVFFGDFGEREHVFSPARRWLAAQKAAFFSLSPAERELAGVRTEQHTQDASSAS
ncbi:hypothetical protein CERSUDRAFT_92417 [Gelatoporia subvermispora B]|uniref:Uncharacterized protein n=1 Tax=Ceriporiopsis subvermispora (strain B) TaxID=914234 RepID=M2RND2_CERS8|nr:hypothetical protein CERSUDRAFT_92417 [Gelatoporia subvermispora B]